MSFLEKFIEKRFSSLFKKIEDISQKLNPDIDVSIAESQSRMRGDGFYEEVQRLLALPQDELLSDELSDDPLFELVVSGFGNRHELAQTGPIMRKWIADEMRLYWVFVFQLLEYVCGGNRSHDTFIEALKGLRTTSLSTREKVYIAQTIANTKRTTHFHLSFGDFDRYFEDGGPLEYKSQFYAEAATKLGDALWEQDSTFWRLFLPWVDEKKWPTGPGAASEFKEYALTHYSHIIDARRKDFAL